MNLPFLQTHRDSAALLFRQRQGFLAAPEGDAEVLGRLETHLRLHLHVLGRSPESKAPARLPDVFVSLAADFTSPSENRRRSGVERGCRWLAEGGARGEGAFAAFSLFPLPSGDESLFRMFRDLPGMRKVLFRLWRRQSADVPPELYDPQTLQKSDPALQQEALGFASERPAVDALFFRRFYHPPLTRGATPLHFGSIVSALRGGVLRRDPDAILALRRCLEQEEIPARRTPLLRMAALTGDPSFLPALQAFCLKSPEEGIPFLALHGTAEAVELLLHFRSEASEAFARSWAFLTGQDRKKVKDGAGEWWLAHGKTWGAGERILQGQPLTAERIAAMALKTTGQAGRDLFDLLAFVHGRPPGCSSDVWQARRKDVLSGITGAPVPAGERRRA